VPDFISLTPADLEMTQVYDILVAGVQPRPIAFISTLDADGGGNLAPFSFFVAGGANPPSVVYSATLNKTGGKKHSLLNVEATKEFVVNTVTREMAEGMNASSFDYPDRYNEWDVCGFAPIASLKVKPPRVKESPVQFECRLFQVVQHGSQSGAACYVIGEVVQMHIREDVWDGRSIDPDAFRPISRLAGANYLDTESLELFSLERPSGDVKPS
jgi:flavin reductase (DIM6/NTAB) family NADH-FMN oxidoreductase RutF